MRAFVLIIVVSILALTASPCSARDAGYMNMTKVQLVRHLGLPARALLFAGPERDMWYYYYTHTDGSFWVFAVGFRDGRVVSHSLDSDFDPRRILLPERPSDLARIGDWMAKNHVK